MLSHDPRAAPAGLAETGDRSLTFRPKAHPAGLRIGALLAAVALIMGVNPAPEQAGAATQPKAAAILAQVLGLRPGTGACAGVFEPEESSIDGTPVCIHGIDTPDQALSGQPNLTPADFPDRPLLPADVVDPPGIPCFASTSTSPVVKVFYIYPKGTPNRLPARDAQLREAVAIADLVYEKSAARTGGVRHVRWKMTPDCRLPITAIAIDPSLSLGGARNVLVSRGLLRSNEKALAFREDGPFCYGMGQLAPDSRPTSSNANNHGGQMAWLMLSPCLDFYPDPMELASGYLLIGEMAAHELAHTLGAVQYNAPHSSHAGHCTDQSDVMCYQDTPWTRLRQVCPPTVPLLLDCKNDDYFTTRPKAGTYLGTHWNIAQNRFLARASPAKYEELPRPSISLSVADGSTLDAGTPVGVTVAGSPDGRAISAVALLVNGEIVDAARAAPFAVPFDAPAHGPPLSTGQTVTLGAIAYDSLGRQTLAAHVSVVVGSTETSAGGGGAGTVRVTILAPADGTTVTGPFDVQVSASGSGTTVVRVDVFVNGDLAGTAVGPDWTVRIDPATLGYAGQQVLDIGARAVGADDAVATDGVTVIYRPS